MHGHTVTIIVKDLYATALIDQIILTLEEKRTPEASTQAESLAKIDNEPSIGDKNNSREDTVDKDIARQPDRGVKLCKERRYWYTPEYDTWETASHTSHNIDARYYERLESTQRIAKEWRLFVARKILPQGRWVSAVDSTTTEISVTKTLPSLGRWIHCGSTVLKTT